MKNANVSLKITPFKLKSKLEIEQWMDFLKRKSPETYRHCFRVAILAEKLAPFLHLNSTDAKRLMSGCFVHDLGKALIPEDILNQKGALTEKQWAIMKLHPEIGAELLNAVSLVDHDILELVRCHHERWDGKGYPDGVKGEEIPYFARICSVIDAFDSMLSYRAYRKPITYSEAIEELCRNSYTQFDGEIVRAFLSASDKMKVLYPSC